MLENFKSVFLHTYYTLLSVLDYRFFIQLSPTLMKLCHSKRDYLVHIIFSLLIVVCGKSSRICCFYSQTCWIWHDVNSDVICSV